MATEIELAWAAGFYDGEGSSLCSIKYRYPKNRTGKYANIQIAVDQNNLDNLHRFRDAMGGIGSITQFRGRCSRWLVSNFEDCQKVKDLLWPYLGKEKRDQFERTFERKRDWKNIEPESRKGPRAAFRSMEAFEKLL